MLYYRILRLALSLTTLFELFYTTSIFINFGFISYLWGVPMVMRSFLGTPGLPMAHTKLGWRNIENTKISNMTKI